MFTMKINNKIVIETQKYERININNEWDVDEVCQSIIEHKQVMIRADLQVSGKTYATQHMIKLGYRVLFVCPTNKLAQNNGVNGVTINKFFGMTINNEESLTKIDASQYDVIVFDELYVVDICKLSKKLRILLILIKIKKIIATGDTSQLEPMNDYSNQKNMMSMLTSVKVIFFLMQFIFMKIKY